MTSAVGLAGPPLGSRPRQKSAPVVRSAITLASVAAAARMVAVSVRSISVVSTLPSAARSMVIAATAPSRVIRIMSVMLLPPLAFCRGTLSIAWRSRQVVGCGRIRGPPMLDVADKTATHAPPKDFQEHLALLEEQGLIVRVDRPIDKNTELHPLVRWQCQGGMKEDARRAFLFTNVTDGAGRKYDMPVVVGALAASPRIYSVGMGRPAAEIEAAWSNAIANPVPPVRIDKPPCQEVVITGDALRQPGQGLAALPVPISTPGFDAAPYLTATLAVTRDPDSGVQNMGTYRAGLKATDRLGVRMAARVGGA